LVREIGVKDVASVSLKHLDESWKDNRRTQKAYLSKQ